VLRIAKARRNIAAASENIVGKRLIYSELDRKWSGYFQGLSGHLKCRSLFVMAGHSRPKDGVASARLCPGHPRL
jgi:hypothetical protein